MEAALSSRLIADQGVGAIVSDSVFWNERPEGSDYPAVVLLLIRQERPRTNDGFDRYRRSFVQFSCFAEDQSVAVALREAVVAAMAERCQHGGVEFLEALEVEVRGRVANTNSTAIHQEVVDVVIFHT